MWGQFAETSGQAGMAPDLPASRQLMQLLKSWANTPSSKDREKIWHDMLHIHADRTLVIGIVNGTLQPVVVSNRLHYVPTERNYNWEPGGHFGVHQPDTFWLVPNAGSL